MSKKGFSLALTLWIVAILSLLSAYYLNYGKKVVEKSGELQIKLNLVLEAESMVEVIKFYGENGVKIFRKHLHLYSKTLPSASAFRDKINKISNPQSLADEIENFFT